MASLTITITGPWKVAMAMQCHETYLSLEFVTSIVIYAGSPPGLEVQRGADVSLLSLRVSHGMPCPSHRFPPWNPAEAAGNCVRGGFQSRGKYSYGKSQVISLINIFL